MLFALAYLLLRRVVRLVGGSSNGMMSTEVEVVVLRHQLKVRKRQAGRPRLRRRDGWFITVLSRAVPRADLMPPVDVRDAARSYSCKALRYGARHVCQAVIESRPARPSFEEAAQP